MLAILICVFITMFSKLESTERFICILFATYLVCNLWVLNYRELSFKDYLDFYKVSTFFFIFFTVSLEKSLLSGFLVLSSVLPQCYYLYLLSNPYQIPEWISLTVLEYADMFFFWSIFVLLHRKSPWKVSEMNLREYIINVLIFFTIIIMG